ncbi:MAG: alpha/beta hydrolase [Lacisediminihabitans sp.]
MTRNSSAHDPSSAATAQSAKRKRLPVWRRLLKVAAIGVASVLALLLISIAANAMLTRSEKSDLVPYGTKVSIAAGDLNVYRNGGTGPTIVLLSGWGTAAPAVDFAPLIRELDAFNVIVIEGFGYGYSDLGVTDRTVENISAEIHEVLAKLGVDSPVILAGHSIGGLYTHYYANAYPGEVAAIIGIDPMTAQTSSLEVSDASTVFGTLADLGLVRVANALAPALVQPNGTAFTTDERKRIVAMTDWTSGNAAVSDEWARMAANSTKAAALPIPAGIPVLEMLATDTINTNTHWLPDHKAELAEVTVHELDIIEGTHYLHWTQAPLMGRTIAAFLAAHLSH